MRTQSSHFYRHNHPRTIVYNQCTNLCLQHAIDTLDGKPSRPLFSIGDKKQLPPMPKPGEVDFIYGGVFPSLLGLVHP